MLARISGRHDRKYLGDQCWAGHSSEQAISAFVMAGTQQTDQSKHPSTIESSAFAYSDRMAIPPSKRITYSILGAAFTGMFLGLSHGSTMAGMVFRAENAHRFPTTQKGWYLYHKSKNYHAMLGGLKDGLKMTRRLSFYAASFFGAEALFDVARGHQDFASTALAGSLVAGGFSALSTWSIDSGPSATGQQGVVVTDICLTQIDFPFKRQYVRSRWDCTVAFSSE